VSFLPNAIAGAATGFLAGGPAGAVAGGVQGALTSSSPSGGNNLSPNNPAGLLAGQQGADASYEQISYGMTLESMRHNLQMQAQSQQYNELTDEQSEQLREVNQMREVAMKQREADNKVVKDFVGQIKE
jgi:hypothetical protein